MPPAKRVLYLLFTKSLVWSPPNLDRSRDVAPLAAESCVATVQAELLRLGSWDWPGEGSNCLGAEIVGRAAVVFFRRSEMPLPSDIMCVLYLHEDVVHGTKVHVPCRDRQGHDGALARPLPPKLSSPQKSISSCASIVSRDKQLASPSTTQRQTHLLDCPLLRQR